MIKQIADQMVYKILQSRFDDWTWEGGFTPSDDTTTFAIGWSEDNTLTWAKWKFKEYCVEITIATRLNQPDEEILVRTMMDMSEVLEALS